MVQCPIVDVDMEQQDDACGGVWRCVAVANSIIELAVLVGMVCRWQVELALLNAILAFWGNQES